LHGGFFMTESGHPILKYKKSIVLATTYPDFSVKVAAFIY